VIVKTSRGFLPRMEKDGKREKNSMKECSDGSI